MDENFELSDLCEIAMDDDQQEFFNHDDRDFLTSIAIKIDEGMRLNDEEIRRIVIIKSHFK